MKRLFIVSIVAIWTMLAFAQEQKKFSPEQFIAELEQYVTQEARLTPQEAAKFFPLYREQMKRQRPLHQKMRRLSKDKPADENGCMVAIQECDKLDMEMKQLQIEYHKRMLEVLPASKVYDAIKAVDKFHRSQLKRWMHHKGKPEKRNNS